MDDLISRQSVLNIFLYFNASEQLEMIKNLPSAQPNVVSVVHGKWVKSGRWGRVYRCDQCGNYLDFDGVNVGRGDANYCPNCGSYMRGEHDE